MEIDKVYEPQRFEPHWAEWWVEHQTYRAEAHPGEPYFSLAIPPPNVTGSLHMGHMFEHSIIDAQVRWRRMRRTPEGKAVDTLWLPGTDHAGIATQIMVERQLAEEGLTKRDLGREAFEARVWKWKEENGGRIVEQMKRAGVSCDWSRERFTLDPGLSRAVREAFVRLYEKGLIYQGDYIVNWCPRCQTALSDLEVEHEETEGSLWHIRYPVVGLDESIVVATTRPETMLGDTGVAINPLDPRAARLHPRNVKLPLTDREIPIVLDDMADPEFGSGAVKITPAHDPNDFEAGKRHDLRSIQVIGEDAKMTAAAGKFAGLDRYEARRQVVAELKEFGFLVKIEPYKLSVGKCHRCKTVVEPLVSKQWWMKMKPLAEPAIAAVEDGRITFVPANWSKTYFEWMYNIRDWCISRQLWWGHRIPAWHCGDCKGVTVAREEPTKCTHCGSAKLTQETDVLDTWFSSGLWPFSTLGWPDDTADLRAFYPTTLLVTGFDIIFFWAARMIMFGMEMMGDVPFRQIHIHGLVRDAERQKMSKTKGNVVDPLVVNDKYGTDAVRFGLLVAAAPGNDIALSEEVILRGRNFANKIWNASRLLFSKSQGEGRRDSLADRWIGSRLNAAVKRSNEAFETHRYHEAADAVWTFFWDEFCDWYLEFKKSDADWGFAYEVHEKALLLLHPLMPFITEELWHRRGHETSIALEPYPQYDPALDDFAAEREMKLQQDIIIAAREMRAYSKIDKKVKLSGILYVRDQVNVELIEISTNTALTVAPGEGLGFDLKLDIPIDLDRLKKENEQLEKVILSTNTQLENQDFVSKAPPKVIDSMQAKLAEYRARRDKKPRRAWRMTFDIAHPDVQRAVAVALAEDVRTGDITTEATIPTDLQAEGRFVARQDMILAGVELLTLLYDNPVLKHASGASLSAGDEIAVVRGPARLLLTRERVALNFLQRLSGVATLAARFVDAVAGTGVRILDTRKTTPGLRVLEKMAAAAGGVVNHRMGLWDSMLIKNNHIRLAGGVRAAIERTRPLGKPIEVEVRTHPEIEEALDCGASRLLLDNMTPAQAAEEIRFIARRAEIEISGGVTLANVRAYAEAGPDFISSGSITHSATAVDVNCGIYEL